MQAIGAIFSLAVISIPTINVSLLFSILFVPMCIYTLPNINMNFCMQLILPVYYFWSRLLQDCQLQWINCPELSQRRCPAPCPLSNFLGLRLTN